MESLLLMVIEVLKNDFLCTTFGLIFIGSNMVFTGFFRRVQSSPLWINWMCYVVPFRVRNASTSLLSFVSMLTCPLCYSVGFRWIRVSNLPYAIVHCGRCFSNSFNCWWWCVEHFIRPARYAVVGSMGRGVGVRNPFPFRPILLVRLANWQATPLESRKGVTSWFPKKRSIYMQYKSILVLMDCDCLGD